MDPWESVEASESFLVRGQFETAATKSLEGLKAILQGRLKSSDIEEDFHPVTECLTAVLIQSFHKLNRHADLLHAIKDHFGTFRNIPSHLFLLMSSLQIMSGNYEIARLSLEEYIVTSPGAKNVCVDRSSLMAAAKLYSLDLLTHALKDATSALHWIENDRHGLLPDEKEVLLKFVISDMQNGLAPSSASHAAKKQSSNESMAEDQSRLLQESECDRRRGPVALSEEQRSLSVGVTARRTQHPQWLVFCSNWLIQKLPLQLRDIPRLQEARHWLKANRMSILLAIIGSVALVGLVKGRAVLSRLGRAFFRLFLEGSFDLWKMAFSVSLNPMTPHIMNAYVR